MEGQENISRLGLPGTGMMTSVGHTLRRRGNISRVWEDLRRRISLEVEVIGICIVILILLRYTDPLGLDAILINKKVDNIMGDALGVEHMGAFFRMRMMNGIFSIGETKLNTKKVEDPNIFDSMDSMNNYLYDHDLYAMENKPYIDSVYIKGDFTLSHQKPLNLKTYIIMQEKEFNGKYNLLWRNCGQVTMRLFSQGCCLAE